MNLNKSDIRRTVLMDWRDSPSKNILCLNSLKAVDFQRIENVVWVALIVDYQMIIP